MKPQKQRLLSPRLLLFMGTMILANIAAQMIFPLESLYVQELGANVEQIGIFFTVAALAPLVLQIIGGWASDSLGRLQAIAIGSIAGTLSYIFYLLAPSWQWLLPSSMLNAMAVAFVAPSFQAFVAEESTPETRGRVYGVTSTLYMVVNIIGPLLGGITAQGFSFKTMYLIAGSFYATAAVVRVLMARRARQVAREQAQNGHAEPKPAPSFAGLKKSVAAMFGLLTAGGVLTWIFISDGVRDIAFSLIGRLVPIYLQDIAGLDLMQISALQSLTAIVAMALMMPAGWLADKKGERVGIVSGFGLMSIGWFIFITAGNFWQFAVSRVIIGGGWALIDPAYSSLISKVVPEKLRGIAFELFSTSLGIISLPAPWIGARLWSTVGPTVAFSVPLVALIAMLPVMWFKFKLPQQHEAKTSGTLVAAPVAVGAD